MTRTTSGGVPDPVRRLAAVGALAGLAVALIYVAVAVGRRWELVLLCLATLAVAVVAAWWVVSRRGAVRAVSAAVALVALGAFVALVLVNVNLTVVLVAVALGLLSAAAARRALHTPAPHATVAARPQRPVLLMNPRSGGGKVGIHDLPERCRELGIEPVVLTEGDDLRLLAEQAVAQGADVIGMAGGDGSQALVADVASRAGVPFVVVPAGTRNHFALDLGLDRGDVAGALEAFVDGVERTVDLAEVNGRVFVNNASMGAYAKVVRSDEYRDAKVRTALSVLPDVLGPAADAIDLRYRRPSGELSTTAHLLLVSNNPYALSPLLGSGTRARLDAGVLGIVSLVVRGAAESDRLARMRRGGRGRALSGLEEWSTAEFVVESAGPVEVGVDGEALSLVPPLRFTIRPAALVLRVPRAAAERSSVVHPASRPALVQLWRMALGRADPMADTA